MNRPSSLTEKTAASDDAARSSCFSMQFLYGSGRKRSALRPVTLALPPSRPSCIDPANSTQFRRFYEIAPQWTSHEAGHSSRISHHQGGDDRRQRIHHPNHLGQGRRCYASRHRPEVAPGLDRRPATVARPRRAAIALPEEILGLSQGREKITAAVRAK